MGTALSTLFDERSVSDIDEEGHGNHPHESEDGLSEHTQASAVAIEPEQYDSSRETVYRQTPLDDFARPERTFEDGRMVSPMTFDEQEAIESRHITWSTMPRKDHRRVFHPSNGMPIESHLAQMFAHTETRVTQQDFEMLLYNVPLPLEGSPNGLLCPELCVLDKNITDEHRHERAREVIMNDIRIRVPFRDNPQAGLWPINRETLKRNANTHSDARDKFILHFFLFLYHSIDNDHLFEIFNESNFGYDEDQASALLRRQTKVQKECIDAVTAMVLSAVCTTGGHAQWQQTTAVHRRLVLGHFFDDAPVFVCEMMFPHVSNSVDFARIFGLSDEDEDVKFWQWFCKSVFLDLAEEIWVCILQAAHRPTPEGTNAVQKFWQQMTRNIDSEYYNAGIGTSRLWHDVPSGKFTDRRCKQKRVTYKTDTKGHVVRHRQDNKRKTEDDRLIDEGEDGRIEDTNSIGHGSHRTAISHTASETAVKPASLNVADVERIGKSDKNSKTLEKGTEGLQTQENLGAAKTVKLTKPAEKKRRVTPKERALARR